MYALFLVLNEIDYLDEILEKFVAVGVRGATILDSQGMAGALAGQQKNAPLFGSLKTFFDSARPYNKTIFTVLDSDELVETTVAAVKEVIGDINRPGVGFMFTVPIGKIYQLNQQ